MSTPTHNFKPCPFCGNSDRESFRILLNDLDEYFVHCANCRINGPTHRLKVLAVRAWNSRKQPKEATS